MPSKPRRTPDSQTPAGRQTARGPGSAGGAARRGTTRGTAGTGSGTGKPGGGKAGAGKSGAGKLGAGWLRVGRAGAGKAGGSKGKTEPRRAGTDKSPSGRSSRRPTARRTTLSSASARRFQRRSGGRFTGRAAILALVVSVLVLTLAYPLREYLAQLAQITAAERAQDEQRARIAALELQKRKWHDPAYIKVQARLRQQLVEPGAVLYYMEYGSPGGATVPDLSGLHKLKVSDQAWYSQLWGSMRAADQPADTLPVDAPVLRGTAEPSGQPTPTPKPTPTIKPKPSGTAQ